MRRWGLLCASLVCLLFLATACGRRSAQPSTPQVTPAIDPVQILHDPQAAKNVTDAILALGYRDEAFTGVDWRGGTCLTHSYLVRLYGQQPSLLITRNIQNGEVQGIPFDEVTNQLHRYINYSGEFAGTMLTVGNEDDFWWIGILPDQKNRTDIYVHFDKSACGFVIDKVWYRGLTESKTVPVSIRLEPTPGWKLN